MSILLMIIRKILKNKWLYSCLLLGLLLSVALVSSIPMYTEGIMNRLLIKSLENYQNTVQKFPGTYTIYYTADDDRLEAAYKNLGKKTIYDDELIRNIYKERFETFTKLDAHISQKTAESFNIPVISSLTTYSTDGKYIIDDNSGKDHGFAYLESISGIENHVRILDGRIPSNTARDGIYEVMVTERVLRNNDLLLNHVYTMTDTRSKGFNPVMIMPVGVFAVKEDDPFWTGVNIDSYLSDSIIINHDLMLRDFVNRELTEIKSARWNFALDYHAINISNVSVFLHVINNQIIQLKKIDKNTDFYSPIPEIVKQYMSNKNSLGIMLWTLNVPVIIMLILYMFMICKIITDKEKNEIALLNSRGATRFQIVAEYFLQGMILSVIAFLLGPCMGYFFTKILGATSGFMEFVNRKAVVTHIGREAYEYSLLVIAAFMVTLLVPVFASSKVSIIDYKRDMARKRKRALWERWFADIILLVVSAYGYYTFIQRIKMMSKIDVSASDISVDPLLFFVPALFIMGSFLLLLRIYPFLIKGIYFIGRRKWKPPIYATLLQVGRSTASYHFLMIFLAVTLSVGLFSASAARTINTNARERVLYKNGADIVLSTRWNSNKVVIGSSSANPMVVLQDDSNLQYEEPPYTPYTELKGVEHTAKVFNKTGVKVKSLTNSIDNVTLMGIEPYDFGNTTWYRIGLLPYDINEYLNLLSHTPGACIISAALSRSANIKAGDNIQMSWPGVPETDFTVMAVVDYWPTFNPYKTPGSDGPDPMLMVANLGYIQNHMRLEPYDVWLKLKPGATTEELYESIKDKELPVLSITNTSEDLTDVITSPFLMAINGALTLGFVVSGLVCVMGFLLYWSLEIKSRTLQYGIFRAIGIKAKKLISMIVWEQVLTSGVAIAGGILIGIITSTIFVPFFRISIDSASMVPPFKVVIYNGDFEKVFLVTGISLMLVLISLTYFIHSLRVDQALKMGEE